MIRRISLIALCLFLCANTAAAASSSSKSSAKAKVDVTLAWKTAADYLLKKNYLPYVQGNPVVTRADLAVALVALTGNVVDIKGYHDCFKDVSDQGFAPAVCFAAKQKWIEPEKDGKFHPESPATFGVTVKGLVRAERFGAKATRGAWYVPFITTAVKEGLIDKGNYVSMIDQPVTRGQLAEMMYRLLLKLQKVSYSVSLPCASFIPVSVSIEQTGTADLQDTSIVAMDAAGKTCIIAHDPLARSDSKHPKLQLTPLVPLLKNSNEGPKTPMVDNVAYFLSKDGDLWSSYVWRLDLVKGTLSQLMSAEAPGAVRISPNYTFLTYVGSKGIDMRVMNLKTGYSKSIRRLSTRVTFLKSLTQSRKVVNSDNIYIDANEMMVFDIYNMHDSSVFQANVHAQLRQMFYPTK